MPKPRVFISHSSIDKRLARRIARRLAQHGADVILDESSFQPGQSLPNTIRGSIESCSHFAVVWTKAAAESVRGHASWIKEEITVAQAHPSISILPLLFIRPER